MNLENSWTSTAALESLFFLLRSNSVPLIVRSITSRTEEASKVNGDVVAIIKTLCLPLKALSSVSDRLIVNVFPIQTRMQLF